MARQRGGQTISQNIQVQDAAPIDARLMVETFDDLTDPSYRDPDGTGGDNTYQFMRVFVKDEQQEYILKQKPHTERANWQVYSGGGGGTPSTPGDSYLDAALVASIDVGGVKKNDTFAKGDDFEKVLRAILNPVMPPTVGNPSATLKHVNASPRYIYGYDETIGTQNFEVVFNRGAISSGGNTVGAATGYTIGGGTGLNNAAALDIDALMGSNTTFSVAAAVSYGAGDQGYNSDGTEYTATPKPAGSINATPTFKFEKRRYIYATIDNDGVLKRLDITTKSSSPLEVSLRHPYPQSARVALPAAATKIEFLNTLNGNFEECTNRFIHTTESLDGITYHVYTDDRTAAAGTRTLKFTF